MVVNIQTRHGEITLRLLRFFFQAYRPPVGSEFDDPVTLRIAHLITENACAGLEGQRLAIEIEISVENVVAENEGRAGAAEKIGADQKCLGDSFRFRLGGVLDADAE